MQKKNKTRAIATCAMVSALVLSATVTPVKAAGQWQETNGNWNYTNEGKLTTGWQEIDNNWYDFDETGKMQTGWIASAEHWYFLGESGIMQNDAWVTNTDGSKFYIKGTGVMATDYVKDGYELDSSGKAVFMTQTTSVELTQQMDINNKVIEGNLYIDTTLAKELLIKGVTVTGKLVLLGDNKTQTKLTITDSNINAISTQTRDSEIVLSGTTTVKNVVLEETTKVTPDKDFKGKVDKIEVQSTTKGEVVISVPAKEVSSRTFATVDIQAPVDKLDIKKNTTVNINADVKEVTINEFAAGTKVEVSKGNTVGTINTEVKVEVGGSGNVDKLTGAGKGESTVTPKPERPTGGDNTNPPVVKPTIDAYVSSKEQFDAAMILTNNIINIQLTADIDLGDVDSLEKMLIVPENKIVILDLNGFTISGKLLTDKNNYFDLQVLKNKGNLTIEDTEKKGVIRNTNEKSYQCTRTIRNDEDSILTLNGGEFSSAKGNALINLGEAFINKDAKLKNGGIINGGWDNAFTTIDNRYKLIINGGTFESEMSVIYTNDKTVSTIINGGQFTAGDSGNIIDAGGGDFKIMGGEYNKSINNNFIPYGYSLQSWENGFKVVKNDAYTIRVNTNEELIAAIKGSAMFKSQEIILNQSLTLNSTDILTLSSSDQLIIPEDVVLTLESAINVDGAMDVKGKIDVTSDGYIGLIQNVKGEINYEFNIESGEVNIEKPMDMQWLAYLYLNGDNSVNKINITVDLDYLGAFADPIGSKDNQFTGEVNGNTHEISNLKIKDNANAAIFGSTNDATFIDLSITNIEIIGQKGYAGVLSAYSTGDLVVKNVNVQGSVTATSYYAGGLIGSIYSTKENSIVSFTDCSTEINVTSNYNIGALFGTSSGSTAIFTISNCKNTGIIDGINTIGIFGGFVNCGVGSTYSGLTPNTGKLFGTSSNFKEKQEQEPTDILNDTLDETLDNSVDNTLDDILDNTLDDTLDDTIEQKETEIEEVTDLLSQE